MVDNDDRKIARTKYTAFFNNMEKVLVANPYTKDIDDRVTASQAVNCAWLFKLKVCRRWAN